MFLRNHDGKTTYYKHQKEAGTERLTYYKYHKEALIIWGGGGCAYIIITVKLDTGKICRKRVR